MPKIAKQTLKAVKRTAGPSFISGIQPVGDLPQIGLKFLIYGLSGSGKTTLACSFPKPLLLIRPEQVEDGSLSVRTVKGVDVTPYLEISEQMTEICNHQQETGYYKTLVLDGVTKFQDLLVKKVGGLKEIPAQLNWGILTQSDWGVVSNELKEHIRQLLRLCQQGCNIVVLGGERGLNTENENVSILMPTVMIALTPSSMGWLHEVCDYNVHTFIRRKTITKTITVAGKAVTKETPVAGVDYCCRIGADAVYQVKFRVPKGTPLPEIIVDATYEKLKRLIEGA
jgi:hypothetical protein